MVVSCEVRTVCGTGRTMRFSLDETVLGEVELLLFEKVTNGAAIKEAAVSGALDAAAIDGDVVRS